MKTNDDGALPCEIFLGNDYIDGQRDVFQSLVYWGMDFKILQSFRSGISVESHTLSSVKA